MNGQLVSKRIPLWSKGRTMPWRVLGAGLLLGCSTSAESDAPPTLPTPTTTPPPSKVVALDRAVYFSSFADWRQMANVPANWLALVLGAFGAVTSLDGSAAPYGNSHQLTTRTTPQLAGSFHGATLVDAATPRTTAGAPVFESVWSYLAYP